MGKQDVYAVALPMEIIEDPGAMDGMRALISDNIKDDGGEITIGPERLIARSTWQHMHCDLGMVYYPAWRENG